MSVPIRGPLSSARVLDRPNRFVLRAHLEATDALVTAHLPDPGRLLELLTPEARIWVRPADPSENRRTEWTAVLVADPNGTLVSLDTQLPNRLVRQALIAEALPELEGWSLERAEVPVGRSRFDFLLTTLTGTQMVLEVKSVSLVEGDTGLFPDAPSERATRHLRELIELAGKTGWYGSVLFIAQRIDARRVRPAGHIDPAFAAALSAAQEAGIRLMARRCQVTLEELVLGVPIPVEL